MSTATADRQRASLGRPRATQRCRVHAVASQAAAGQNRATPSRCPRRATGRASGGQQRGFVREDRAAERPGQGQAS